MCNQKRVYDLSKDEIAVAKWVAEQAIEMRDGMQEDDPDEVYTQSLACDMMIENWQECSNEEIEELHIGLHEFILGGSGRFDYEFDKAKSEAIHKELNKYFKD